MKLDPIAKAVFDGLLNAYNNHINLGASGSTKDKKNRFGDMAMRADIQAEELIFSSLKKLSEENSFRIICKSEELGDQELNPSAKKTLFAVFDGLDGSANYLSKSDFGYGTMIALADNENPKYQDFFVAGMAMMEEGKIVLAVKNDGVYLYDMANDGIKKLDKFSQTEVFADDKTLANKYFPEELKAYGDKPWIMTGSTAWSIYSICTDKKFNALIEVTRKKNLEQPILYLLITELGGVMVDKNGVSIGQNSFADWGQARDGEEFLITAKSEAVASTIMEKLDTPLK